MCYLCRLGGFLNLQVGLTGRSVDYGALKGLLAVFKRNLKMEKRR